MADEAKAKKLKVKKKLEDSSDGTTKTLKKGEAFKPKTLLLTTY